MVFVEMLLELDLESPMEQTDLTRYLYNQLQSRHIQLHFPSVDQLLIFQHLKVYYLVMEFSLGSFYGCGFFYIFIMKLLI